MHNSATMTSPYQPYESMSSPPIININKQRTAKDQNALVASVGAHESASTAVFSYCPADTFTPSSFSFPSLEHSWYPMDLSPSLFRFENDSGHYYSPSPGTDNVHARDFETAFCRDFYCCGLWLFDLHDLLQHYEEFHVRFQDDESNLDGKSLDFFDDDSWCDSDSTPSSPSSVSPPGSVVNGLATLTELAELRDLGSSTGSGLSGQSAAAMRLYPAFQSNFPKPLGHKANHVLPQQHPLIHSTHPLYRHPPSNSSSNNIDCADRSTSTHAPEAFPANFDGSTKRKAALSLVEIHTYGNSDICDESLSAFSDIVLRTGAHGHGMARPHAKRQAMEAYQLPYSGSVHSNAQLSQSLDRISSEMHPFPVQPVIGYPAGPLRTHPDPYSVFNGGYGSIAPLLRDHAPAGHSDFLNSTTAADLMRQRDEVYSLMEDITRTGNVNAGDKPYRCTVLGCDKAYKNPNGLKYHNLHGHCSNGGMGDTDSPESKPYVCTFLECGKRYKNLNGLKYHIEHSHPNLTAALRAHQSGLINPHIFGPYPSQAAMTIAAALQAVNSSPMMMAAANAIMTAQAVNAANATNAENVHGSSTPGQAPAHPYVQGSIADDTHVGSTCPPGLVPGLASGARAGPAR